MKGHVGVDLFGDGEANNHSGGFDHGFFYLDDLPIVVGHAVGGVDGVDAKEADIGFDLPDLRDGFTADGDAGILRHFVADEDDVDGGVVCIFEGYGQASGDKGGFEFRGEMTGQFNEGRAAGGHY